MKPAPAVAAILLACAAVMAPAAVPVTAASTAPAANPAGAARAVIAPTAAPAGLPTRLINAPQLRDQLNAQRGKVVVLNLWATWCMPCLKEIPVLLQVTQQLAPRGVALIGVAMDEPQSLQAQVEPFRLKFFPTFTTWLREESDMDSIASVVDAAWNEILPTTYIIGRNGKLRTKIQGVRSAEQFRASIEAALQAGQ